MKFPNTDSLAQSEIVNSETVSEIISDPYIVFPASYFPHKNHVNLLRAYARLRQEYSGLKIIFTGGIPKSSHEINVAIEDLELSGDVHELGYLNRLRLESLISDARCLVVPSFFESKSFPVAEAMMLGTPVLASRIDGVLEQIPDPLCSFDPYSVDSIYGAVKRFFELDSKAVEGMVKKNHDFINRRNWEDVAHDYFQIWAELGGTS